MKRTAAEIAHDRLIQGGGHTANLRGVTYEGLREVAESQRTLQVPQIRRVLAALRDGTVPTNVSSPVRRVRRGVEKWPGS
jgi:hypothetical protein